jgi:hypothetical protein
MHAVLIRPCLPKALIPRLLLLIPLCLAGGCNKLGHDKETIVAAFPPGKDEVRLLLIYEGFHVPQEEKTKLGQAKDELDRLMASEREFRLGYWPLFFNLDRRDNDNDAEKQLVDFLRAHITIRKGAFFQSRDGALNGYQTVTIRDAQKFIAGWNERISAWLAEKLPEELAKPKRDDDAFDKESLERLLQAARKKHTWIKLEPGRISLTLPGTQSLFERGKRESLKLPALERLHQEIATSGQGPGSADRGAQRDAIAAIERNAIWLSQLPLSIDQRKDRLTLSLGFGDGESITMGLPNEPRTRNELDKELVAHARKLKVPFREGITVDSLIADFLMGIERPK